MKSEQHVYEQLGIKILHKTSTSSLKFSSKKIWRDTDQHQIRKYGYNTDLVYDMSEENSVLDTETTSDNTISSQNGFYLVAKKETVENEVNNTKCRQTKPSTDNIIV